jgi:DNA-binding CsgD family transcriptional regulator
LSEERWLAHVLPLTSGVRRQAGDKSTATAAVFVRKAALDMPTPVETLARIYKLTGSEVRVLHGVVEIGGAREIAKALGIAQTTVRTHLQSLFAKTGARRQADLVKLVAEHASPLGRSHV